MRILLHYVLPLLLPTMIWLVWAWTMRHKKAAKGLAWWEEGPWFWLVIAGFLLMAAGLATVALTSGFSTDAEFERPRWEDGRVVPGQVRQ